MQWRLAQTQRQTDIQTDGQADILITTFRQVGTGVDWWGEWMDGWMEEWVDGWMDKWIYKRIDMLGWISGKIN